MVKLYRSKTDRLIGGVCGGFAQFFHIHALFVRLLWIAAIAAIWLVPAIPRGIGIIAYLICWVVIPENPAQQHKTDVPIKKSVHSKIKSTAKDIEDNVKRAEFDGIFIVASLFILVGIYFLLENIFGFGWIDLKKIWPLVILFVGLKMIMTKDKKFYYYGSGILLAVLSIVLLLYNYEVLNVTLLKFWPVLLIVIGISTIVTRYKLKWYLTVPLWTMVIFIVCISLIYSLYQGSGVLTDTKVETLEQKLEDGVRDAQISLEFGTGILSVTKIKNADLLFKGSFESNTDGFLPQADYSTENERAKLQVGFLKKEIKLLSLHTVNKWDILLTDKIPIDLNINSGSSSSKIDLGGMMVRSLKFESGTSDAKIRFSERNSIDLTRLDIQSGASKLQLLGLGNSSFRRLDLVGGVGEYTLDFSGIYSGDGFVNINTGTSEIELIYPDGIGIDIESNSFMNKVSGSHSLTRYGTRYVSDEFENNSIRYHIDINSDVSSIKLTEIYE